jgi:hypothetical protein
MLGSLQVGLDQLAFRAIRESHDEAVAIALAAQDASAWQFSITNLLLARERCQDDAGSGVVVVSAGLV